MVEAYCPPLQLHSRLKEAGRRPEGQAVSFRNVIQRVHSFLYSHFLGQNLIAYNALHGLLRTIASSRSSHLIAKTQEETGDVAQG